MLQWFRKLSQHPRRQQNNQKKKPSPSRRRRKRRRNQRLIHQLVIHPLPILQPVVVVPVPVLDQVQLLSSSCHQKSSQPLQN